MEATVATKHTFFLWCGLGVAAAIVAITGYLYTMFTRCDRAANVGLRELEIGQDVSMAFPSSEQTILYCDGKYSVPTWQAKVGLFDRYVITIQVPVHINSMGTHLNAVGDPVIVVSEVQSIASSPSGQREISYAWSKTLASHDWDELMRANGKIEIIVPNCNKTPVAGFKAALPDL